MRVLPQQAEVLAYTGQMAAVRGGIRSGKSLMFASWMHDRMEMYPDAQHFVVGANLPQLKRGFLRSFTQLLTRFGVEFDYRTSEGYVTLKHNGAKLEAISAELQDRIRSVEMDTVLLEEPQTWTRDAEGTYQIIVGRMSGSMAGQKYLPEIEPQLRMSFNPSAVGTWIWEMIEERHTMPCWQFSVRDNFLLPNQAKYIALQESQLPEHLWTVELDGNWASFGGSVYQYYLREWHSEPKDGLPAIAYNADQPLLWTLDFNVGFMCSVVAQAHVQRLKVVGYEETNPILETQVAAEITAPVIDGYQRTVFYLLDEIRLTDARTPEVVQEFINRWGAEAKRNGVVLYGDASGASRSQTSILSNWGIIIDGLERAGIPWEWRVQNVNPNPGDRINALNTQMKNPDGIGMLIDHGRCPYFVRDLQAVRYKNGKGDLDKDTDPSLTHLSDAVGYMVWVEHMLLNGEKIDWRELRDSFDR